MRVTRRLARRFTLTAVAALMFVSVAPANSQDVSTLQEAFEIAMAYALPISDADQPDAEPVIEGGGGRDPIRVVAHSSFVFDERVDPLAPAFGDTGPDGVEVIADFIPDSSAFYDVSLQRVVHAFKLSRVFVGCEGFDEFALFYAQAGSPTFPAREGLNSPDLGMSHASAIACVDAALRSFHVQAAQLGVEYGPAHRALVVTAPDLADPTKRCTWVLLVTENPDVEFRPVLASAETFGDLQTLSFRPYAPSAPTPMDLDGESETMTPLVRSLLRGTGVVPGETTGEPTETPTPPAGAPESPQVGETLDPPANESFTPPVFVADIPEDDPDSDTEWIWVAVPVVVAGVIVAWTIVGRQRARKRFAWVESKEVWTPSDDDDGDEAERAKKFLAGFFEHLEAQGYERNDRDRYEFNRGELRDYYEQLGETSFGEDVERLFNELQLDYRGTDGGCADGPILRWYYGPVPCAFEVDPSTFKFFEITRVGEVGPTISMEENVVIS